MTTPKESSHTTAPTGPPRLVTATHPGFLGGQRIRTGVTFSCPAAEFSSKWMREADDGAVDEIAAKNHPRPGAPATGARTRREVADQDDVRRSNIPGPRDTKSVI